MSGDIGRRQISVYGVSSLARGGEFSKQLRKFRVKHPERYVLLSIGNIIRKKVDLYCVQETRKRGGRRRIVKNKNSSDNLYWSENNKP